MAYTKNVGLQRKAQFIGGVVTKINKQMRSPAIPQATRNRVLATVLDALMSNEVNYLPEYKLTLEDIKRNIAGAKDAAEPFDKKVRRIKADIKAIKARTKAVGRDR